MSPLRVICALLGLMARDCNGSVLFLHSSKLQMRNIEAAVWCWPLNLVVIKGWGRIIVESDPRAVVDRLNRPSSIVSAHWESFLYLLDCIRLKEAFLYCLFDWVPRLGNKVARCLCRWALRNNWDCDIPFFLVSSLLDFLGSDGSSASLPGGFVFFCFEFCLLELLFFAL